MMRESAVVRLLRLFKPERAPVLRVEAGFGGDVGDDGHAFVAPFGAGGRFDGVADDDPDVASQRLGRIGLEPRPPGIQSLADSVFGKSRRKLGKASATSRPSSRPEWAFTSQPAALADAISTVHPRSVLGNDLAPTGAQRRGLGDLRVVTCAKRGL